MKKTLIIAIMAITVLFAEDSDIATVFDNLNVSGTMVIASLDGKTQYIHNDNRANLRLLPASTFKIPSSLIALEEGLVDPTDTLLWDSIPRDIANWNQDQTLATAFRYSCVPVYQQLASRVGIEKFREYVRILQYGNQEIGTDTTHFWLSGDFGISPLEQVELLRGIINRQFPFSVDNYNILREIMIHETGDDYTIRAKTGWVRRESSPHHGWFVGYVETESGTWIFATNILTDGAEDLPLREAVTREALKIKGIL